MEERCSSVSIICHFEFLKFITENVFLHIIYVLPKRGTVLLASLGKAGREERNLSEKITQKADFNSELFSSNSNYMLDI